MSTFKMEDLQKLIDSMLPDLNSKDIDDFVAKGNKIENVVLITKLAHMEDVTQVRTKHGVMRVKYSNYLPLDMPAILINEPKRFW
ncbi:hypothetical protein QFZ77_002466 [Paenibacillus sp. V4I3]|uniref:hypothetical protein n=1 Tax=Paenibacillus sp. V4I3 TaxID=3042305 RepID=UPI0027815770|nr:hypothetical protein [Paenibacillus sp. V4I3]MDQ0873807.1 hypothetical protein [Paenibacillus sp. V4I3]